MKITTRAGETWSYLAVRGLRIGLGGRSECGPVREAHEPMTVNFGAINSPSVIFKIHFLLSLSEQIVTYPSKRKSAPGRAFGAFCSNTYSSSQIK